MLHHKFLNQLIPHEKFERHALRRTIIFQSQYENSAVNVLKCIQIPQKMPSICFVFFLSCLHGIYFVLLRKMSEVEKCLRCLLRNLFEASDARLIFPRLMCAVVSKAMPGCAKVISA